MKKILFFLAFLFSHGLEASGPTCPSYGIPDPAYFNLSSAGTHPDYILKLVMKDVWLAYISDLSINHYDNTPRVNPSLDAISQICSDQYGDAIHLARSLVSYQGSVTYYDAYDGCNDTGYSSPRSNLSKDIEMNVSPNPTTGNIMVDFNVPTSGKIELYSMQGILEKSISLDGDTNVSLFLERSGVHIIKYIQDNGSIITKKVININ